jgi:uncharacterized repeat protein (TIGR02543 family)
MIRCKNCGSENDDNLYICQNCGSPLYDEDEEIDAQNGSTQVFKAVGDDISSEQKASGAPSPSDEKEKKKKQQNIAIIVILVIILLAIIIGVIVAVASNSKDTETTTQLTTVSTTAEVTTQKPNSYNTTTTTTQTTTETTTESTTATTTTAVTTFTVSLSCNDGGEVDGDGTYKRGENVTVTAKPDDGYEFDGWYKGSTKVSSSTKYKFTVTDNTSLEAVFVISNSEIDVIDGDVD